jgi:hypothetical protein
METKNDEQQLKSCLTQIIDLLQVCLHKLKPTKTQSQTDIKEDNLLQNSQLNNNVYTFSLSTAENELLDTLTSDIQTVLNKYVPRLSPICSKYLLDFLHTYHYNREKKEFTSSLSMGELHSFRRDLEGLLASSKAFSAAFNGQLDVVKKFIAQYPTYKDKPGLWETTLLYSAARNDRTDIVRYLIEEAHCSVNAQNQREVDFALQKSEKHFTPRPTAGSTALHGACFNNHLNIVKYLVEHGADYFIENQAHETPLLNGTNHVDIKKYFQDYLVLGYADETADDLPDHRIMEDDRRPIQDCMWEYKPFQDPKWYRFSKPEAMELQKALLPTEEFQQQVHLQVTKGLYSVSMIEFYRSGRREQDPQKNMAWIRCRGSSILNFDCYSIWQIMLIQHRKVSNKEDTVPSLKIQHFPTMSNSRFKLQLNTWYSCDVKTNSLLDRSMNYRRKVISMNVPYVSDNLKFNLQAFEFSNKEKTIFGYIRWIPKLISSTDKNEHKLVYVDNYKSMANIQPTPLTVQLWKEFLQMKSVDQKQKNDLTHQGDDDDDESGLQIATTSGNGNDDEGDDDDNVHLSDKNKVCSKNYL